MAGGWPDDPGTLALLRDLATTDTEASVRQVAVAAFARAGAGDPGALALLRDLATTDTDGDVRRVAVHAIARHHPKAGQQASD
ncbi:HEAT repeat domain-containing protein [Embleya sp. NPDC055610]